MSLLLDIIRAQFGYTNLASGIVLIENTRVNIQIPNTITQNIQQYYTNLYNNIITNNYNNQYQEISDTNITTGNNNNKKNNYHYIFKFYSESN